MKSEEPQEGTTFLQHLYVLRKHLMRIVLYFLVATIVAFIYRDFVFDTILFAPRTPGFITNVFLCRLADLWDITLLCINQHPVQLVNTSMTGQFTVHITVSLVAGFIISFPMIVWEIWRFIKPALYAGERKNTRWIILVVSFLFFIGALFGYYIVVPLSLNFLAEYMVSSQVENLIAVTSYCSTVSSLVFACAVLFELPALTYVLSRIGMLTPSTMNHYRRHAIVVIFIIAALITPPDVFSQTLVAIPLLVLYEISILVSKFAINKK